jgi:hypothetical protein
MDREPIGTDRHSAVAKLRHHFLKHRGRSPDPSKTHAGHGAMVAGLAGNFVT